MNRADYDDERALEISVRRLSPDAVLPTRAHATDAGADLYSVEKVHLAPGERALVGTGIALALPAGTVGLIHPRSGLAASTPRAPLTRITAANSRYAW